MIYQLTDKHTIASTFLSEMRDIDVQKDRLRFRQNIERITNILAYEASKLMNYSDNVVQTPLGQKETKMIENDIVIASILRAGIPMHFAMLNFYDRADNCFISAYRKHHKSGEFEIRIEYLASPELSHKTLILCDPMIATGASIISTLQQLKAFGTPEKIIVLGIIGSTSGVNHVQNSDKSIDILIGDIDDELTAKSYIVPGLGDAGDLAFGSKLDI